MHPHLDILPRGQRRFWDDHIAEIPPGWVLYGGTALALRFGHRKSEDFDFFSSAPFSPAALLGEVPALRPSSTLQRAKNTLVVSVPIGRAAIKVSFFGGLKFGRVADPDLLAGACPIASPLDLFATKLAALFERVEAKDYLDVAALIRAGFSLNQGLAALVGLFGAKVNAFDAAKAVGWFSDGGLDRKLDPATKALLIKASRNVDPAVRPLPRVGRGLTPGRRR